MLPLLLAAMRALHARVPPSLPIPAGCRVGAHCYAVLVTVHALCLHGMVSWSGHLPSLCVRAVASPLHALCCVCNTLLLRIVGNALALLHFSGVRIHTHVCPPCPTWFIPHAVLAYVHAHVRMSAVFGESGVSRIDLPIVALVSRFVSRPARPG